MGYNPNIPYLKVGYKPFRKPLILTSNGTSKQGGSSGFFPLKKKTAKKTPGDLQGSNTVDGFLNASNLLEICDANIDYDESHG